MRLAYVENPYVFNHSIMYIVNCKIDDTLCCFPFQLIGVSQTTKGAMRMAWNHMQDDVDETWDYVITKCELDKAISGYPEVFSYSHIRQKPCSHAATFFKKWLVERNDGSCSPIIQSP